ncbi:acetate--CoA ligase family protein [Aquabacter sp. CN5-332]|uniref:acetate--CoA ligase family protein n=1 Tax=Aquabacter sp. CN5-332 TaxID=3156608 RepID=UPI0032B52642
MTLPFDKLMNPRSVAIVGASERSDAIGTRVLNNLRTMGFSGRIYPVNPRYPEISGLTAYPSLSALPETVDAVFIAVPASGGPELVEEAGRCGIKAVFINANGYADGDADGAVLQRRVETAAKAHGIAIAGPNNLGLINVHDGVAMWTPRYMKKVTPGPVGVISQSGSIALILSEDERDLGFAYLVTTGNEAGATVADYLMQMAQDDRVNAILLFLETIRDPSLFEKAAREAACRGKKIIALKLGTSEGGRALVQAHTGSLAGEDRLYDAFFKALGIIRVRDLDEMLETAVLLSGNPNPPPKTGTAVVTLSGGEAALLADVGGELGLPFPKLAPETLERLRPAFPPYSTIGNPVDAWGLGFNPERFTLVLEALLADPDLGTIGFSVDAPGRGGGDVPYACVMARACVAAKTDKRLVFFNNTSGSGVNEEVREILDTGGIPYLSGMRPALAAMRNLVNLREAPVAVPEIAVPPAPLPSGEVEQFRQLATLGVPMVAAEKVGSAEEAVKAAERLGYPVVLKGIATHLPHKSDLGLVKLKLGTAADVTEAFHALEAILALHAKPGAPGYVVVQAMAREGVELIVGIRNQKGFGSFVIVGPGGVLVEISNQASVRLGPVTRDEAREMLFETAAGTLLKGVRGKPAADIDAAAEAIAAFSRFGAAHADSLAALEINPLIAGPAGTTGVDLLLEAHSDQKSEG